MQNTKGHDPCTIGGSGVGTIRVTELRIRVESFSDPDESTDALEQIVSLNSQVFP